MEILTMPIFDAILMWAHLVSASIWVGGSIFIGIVLAPLLKTISESVEERVAIMIRVGRKFNKIAIPSLVILIGTGLYSSSNILGRPEFLFSTNYGIILVIKIILVISLLVMFAIHVRIIRTEIEQKIKSKEMLPEIVQKLRSKIISLGRIMVFVSVAILLMAALLHSGI
jgi:putative copper resistance protein D